MARVVVNVMPKEEILDPQGQAVQRALGRIGITGVNDVRQGKRFVIEADDSLTAEQVQHMAETLLANTVVEDFEIVDVAVEGGKA
ncbi:phosphoribosylformylglycinamidine synthase subunit PurS [Corynebacterium choanae]|uniref:Phosphoribosylformylglycinamidine synthase subunit PurS n=1 Tax=Corynebacterium choanae TaxID=1862358 RepID=A0A3G6J7B3_9CORY|nr:phosphoribosylformylglycinamidine synthase subunit PurS [Corynebacterium choanae]AZA12808.1 phosphoribosylformylglycinamidine synthase subunit PurS [Corynebacterium choanae]